MQSYTLTIEITNQVDEATLIDLNLRLDLDIVYIRQTFLYGNYDRSNDYWVGDGYKVETKQLQTLFPSRSRSRSRSNLDSRLHQDSRDRSSLADYFTLIIYEY